MRRVLLFLFFLFVPSVVSAQWSLGLGLVRQDLDLDGIVTDAVLDGEVLLTGVSSVGYERGVWNFVLDLENGSVSGGGGFLGSALGVDRTRIELSGSRTMGEVLSLLAGVRRDTIEVTESFLNSQSVLDFESTVAEAGIRLQSRPRGTRFYFEAIAGAGPADVRTLVIDDSSSALLLQGEAGIIFSPGNWQLTPGVRLDRLRADDVEVGATSIFFEARYRFGG